MFGAVTGFTGYTGGHAFAAGIVVTEVRVSASSDDAEEKATGSTSLTSSDLELVEEAAQPGVQTIGIRFEGLDLPNFFDGFSC